jgi:hypothetical protein
MTEIKRTYALPLGYAATFRWRSGHDFGVEWAPELPAIRKPGAWGKFCAAYQQARRTFLEEVAMVIGGNVAVADWGQPRCTAGTPRSSAHRPGYTEDTSTDHCRHAAS